MASEPPRSRTPPGSPPRRGRNRRGSRSGSEYPAPVLTKCSPTLLTTGRWAAPRQRRPSGPQGSGRRPRSRHRGHRPRRWHSRQRLLHLHERAVGRQRLPVLDPDGRRGRCVVELNPGRDAWGADQRLVAPVNGGTLVLGELCPRLWIARRGGGSLIDEQHVLHRSRSFVLGGWSCIRHTGARRIDSRREKCQTTAPRNPEQWVGSTNEDRRPDKPPTAICLVGGDLGARPPVASAAGTVPAVVRRAAWSRRRGWKPTRSPEPGRRTARLPPAGCQSGGTGIIMGRWRARQ